MRDELSIVVVGHRRPDVLAQTIRTLRRQPDTDGARLIVVINGDGANMTGDLLAGADTVLRLRENTGVDAYNHGMTFVKSEFALVLDDDAAPQPGVVLAALDVLRTDQTLGAAALHPVVGPAQRSEWPFARTDDAGRRDWPLLGCGPIVRTAAWRAVGGYEARYFLYGNDTDLALKLLGTGRGVTFDPAWRVLHDTQTAFERPAPWFRLATRNRIWNARRHAGRLWPLGALLAWADSHRRARWRARAHALAVRGAWEGIVSNPPRWITTSASAAAFRTLVHLSARRRSE